MAVKIRLARRGSKGKPFYRIVVADARSPRDGAFIDRIGTYDPQTEPSDIKVDAEKARDWIKDFLLKVGYQALLFNLFLIAIGSVLVLAGYLACCIGIIPVAFFLMGPVMAHFHEQLYRMYLAKGGEPIPLKPLQMEPAYSLPAPGPIPPKPPM